MMKKWLVMAAAALMLGAISATAWPIGTSLVSAHSQDIDHPGMKRQLRQMELQGERARDLRDPGYKAEGGGTTYSVPSVSAATSSPSRWNWLGFLGLLGLLGLRKRSGDRM